MKFEEAIEALKIGARIRRSCWLDMMYVRQIDENKYAIAIIDENREEHIIEEKKNTSKMFSFEDVMAEDWNLF